MLQKKFIMLLFIMTLSMSFLSCVSEEDVILEHNDIIQEQPDTSATTPVDTAQQSPDTAPHDDSNPPDNEPIDDNNTVPDIDNTPPLNCNENEVKPGTEPCGFNGNGLINLICKNNQWVSQDDPETAEVEGCEDPDKCPDKFTQYESCENGTGTYGRICEKKEDGTYDFAEFGECVIMVDDWDYSGGYAGWGEGKFAFPQWIALDADKNIYITEPGAKLMPKKKEDDYDKAPNWVQVFSNDGTFLKSFAPYNAPLSERYDDSQPYQNLEGIVIDIINDIVYIADGFENYDDHGQSETTGNQRVLKFKTDGTFLGTISDDLSYNDPAYLQKPIDLALDSKGYLYVLDNGFNTCIKKFDSDGNLQTEWADNGALCEFNENKYLDDGSIHMRAYKDVWGIGIDTDDNLYVANYYNCSIDKFDPTGKETLMRFGHIRQCADQYHQWFPSDVAISDSGDIYVSVTGGFRAVQKYTADGTFLTEIVQIGGEGPLSYYYPRAVLVDGDTLYSVDSARGVYKFKIQ